MDNFKKTDDVLSFIAEMNMKIAVLCLVTLLLINGLEIVIRMIADKSMIWIQDISVLLMVWMIFCGTTKIVYDKKDIVIKIFVDKVKGKKRIIIDIIAQFCVLTFLIIYCIYGYKLIITQWTVKTLVAEIRQIYYTFPVIVMGASCSFIYINEIYLSFKKFLVGGEA